MDKYIKKYVKEHKFLFALIVAGYCLSVLLTLPIPMASKFIIDDVLIGGTYSLIVPLISVLLACLVFQLAVLRLNAWSSSLFFQGFINHLRKRVVNAFLSSSGNESRIASSGNLLVVLSSDIPSLSQLNSSIVATVCGSAFAIVGYLGMLLLLNWRLALISLLIFPLYYLWIYHVSKVMQRLTEKTQALNEELLGKISVVSDNMETIIANCYSRAMSTRLGAIIESIGGFARHVILYSNFVNSVSTVISAAAGMTPLFAGIYFVSQQQMTIGDLIVFNSYCGLLLSPVSALMGILTKTKLALVHESRIDSLLERCVHNGENQDVPDFYDRPYCGLEVENYRLMGRFGVLLSVDYCHFDSGRRYLISGENGAGKTLLLKSFASLYYGYEGSVYYNDVNVKNFSSGSYAKRVAYVSPGHDFVLDNLEQELFDEKELPRKEICALLKDFGLTYALDRLPDGLQTSCVGLDAILNTGSMQKLRILRALTLNPSVLILDELLSNLSQDECEKVLRTIRFHFPTITLIVVDHHTALRDQFDFLYKIECKKLIRER